jgi:kynurenine 3-monooxygenase
MSASHPVSDRLAIVGAGLVGSLLAMYLARRGYGIDLFERHPDTRVVATNGGRPVRPSRPSVNLTLCERGLAALDGVGLRDRVLELAVPVRGRRIHGRGGSIVFQPYSPRGDAIYSISRNELNELLVTHAEREPGVAFHFDHKLVGLDARRGVATFVRGGGVMLEVGPTTIFGADGAYSGVRMQLQKTELFDYSQQYAQQGYTELVIPPGPGGKPMLEPDALHIWPRGELMLIGFPNRDGSVTCAFYAPFHGASSFAELTDEAKLAAVFRDQFPDVEVPGLAQQFFARPANTMVTVRCNPWSRHGTVLLLGDAAHSILPSYGQGANAGFEDCAVLDRCLDRQGTSWAETFAALERLRRPDLDVIAGLCVDHFRELSDHIADPRFLVRKAIERDLQAIDADRFASLYSRIAFTRTPYAEAVERDRFYRTLVDRIVAVPSEMARLVETYLKEVA